MPVRSLRSPVLQWPPEAEVVAALRRWARDLDLPGLVALGCHGSYARGEAGVGSDLDLVLIVEQSDQPIPLRAVGFRSKPCPYPPTPSC